MLEVSLLGLGTVLRLERDAWSVVEILRQTANEYAPHAPSVLTLHPSRKADVVHVFTIIVAAAHIIFILNAISFHTNCPVAKQRLDSIQ